MDIETHSPRVHETLVEMEERFLHVAERYRISDTGQFLLLEELNRGDHRSDFHLALGFGNTGDEPVFNELEE